MAPHRQWQGSSQIVRNRRVHLQQVGPAAVGSQAHAAGDTQLGAAGADTLLAAATCSQAGQGGMQVRLRLAAAGVTQTLLWLEQRQGQQVQVGIRSLRQ